MNEMIEDLNNTPTPMHFIENARQLLLEKGFIELKENENWPENLDKFFVVRSEETIIACKVHDYDSCRIYSSNLDYPCFKIKPNSGHIKDDCEQLCIQQYGYGMWCTWMDRDLAVAGQVIIKDKNTGKEVTKLFRTKRSFCTIPSLASHLTKPPKETCNLDAEMTFLPIVKFVDSTGDDKPIDSPTLLKAISDELNCDISDIVDYNLSLISAEESKLIGINDEMAASQCLSSILQAKIGLTSFIDNDVTHGMNIFYGYSGECTLSASRTGYNSNFLDSFFKRLKITNPAFKENSLIFGAVRIPSGYVLPGYGAAYRYGFCGKSQTPTPILHSFVKKLVSKQILTNRCTITYDINNGAENISIRLHTPALYFGIPIISLHSIREVAFMNDIHQFLLAASAFFDMT